MAVHLFLSSTTLKVVYGSSKLLGLIPCSTLNRNLSKPGKFVCHQATHRLACNNSLAQTQICSLQLISLEVSGYKLDYPCICVKSHVLPQVLVEILSELDIGQFVVKLNHRRLLDAMMDLCGVPPAKFRAICRYSLMPWHVLSLPKPPINCWSAQQQLWDALSSVPVLRACLDTIVPVSRYMWTMRK